MNKFESGVNMDMAKAGEDMEARREQEAKVLEASHQRVEKYIEELAAKSRFESAEGEKGGAEVLKSPEGEEFRVQRIENPFDPRLREAWRMSKDEFGDEADPLSWVRESVRQGINNYDVITAPDGRVVSYTNSRYLEMESTQEGSPAESMVYTAFINTAEDYRRQGLGVELMQRVVAGAVEKAREEGHAIKGMIGECTETSESFWNKVGKNRMYFEDVEGNVVEVPYKAPPCDYDDKTGEPLVKGAAEHLMVNLFDGRTEITAAELVEMVRPIYFEEYGADPEDYSSKKAWERTQEVLNEYLKELEAALAGARGGRIFMMSAEERAARESVLANQGKQLVEVKGGE